jgi:plastocyanin
MAWASSWKWRLRWRLCRPVKALPLVAGLVILAGCGGSKSAPTTSTVTTAALQTIVVEEKEYTVRPSVSTVRVGTYTFKGVNKGTIPHVLELEGPGSENETAPIAPGRSANLELVLRTPGTYELYCPLDDHKKKGMKATFFVLG